MKKQYYSPLKNKDHINIIINKYAITTDNFSENANIYLSDINEYLNNQKWFVDDDDHIFICNNNNIYYLYSENNNLRLTQDVNKLNVKLKI